MALKMTVGTPMPIPTPKAMLSDLDESDDGNDDVDSDDDNNVDGDGDDDVNGDGDVDGDDDGVGEVDGDGVEDVGGAAVV